tara:strand:+ start:368 stop:673 length:306 start_codon:yes stop_codon:yes gene_type:complete
MKKETEKLSNNNNANPTPQNEFNQDELLNDLKNDLKNSIDKTSEIFFKLLADIDKTVKDEEIHSSTVDIIKNISTEFRKISSLAQDELRDIYKKNNKSEEE